jgi:hypothetical protein
MKPTMTLWRGALLLSLLAGGGCDYDIANPNSPETIGEDPSRGQVAAAATGLLVATRVDYADYVLDVGILGREAYRFDPSDPAFITELIIGPLDPGSDPFGGDHWAEQYAAIRGANALLAAVPTATRLTVEEQSAVNGFARTLQALNFLLVLGAHTQDSIPIEIQLDVTAPPAPFVSNAAAYDHVVALLDQARAELQAGGAAFPFSLPPGFAGFNTPATFIQFNRALRARVAVYRGDFAGALAALGESFVNPDGPLETGVYLDYGTGPGDVPNPLSQDPQVGENVVHPSVEAGAQLQPGGAPDQRFLSKTVARPPASGGDPPLSSDLGWIRYPSPSSPIPIIKNEELLLLRAEANIGLGQLALAAEDINRVRTRSGLLAPVAAFATPEAALDELLYNRLYSLLYEGGHRWIDARRTNRLATLPVDRPGDQVFVTLPVPRDEVLARQ